MIKLSTLKYTIHPDHAMDLNVDVFTLPWYSALTYYIQLIHPAALR